MIVNEQENVAIFSNEGRRVVIADLDGTIADDSKRAENLARITEEKGREGITDLDWKAYFQRCDEDEIFMDTRLLLGALKQAGWYVMILTSRCSSVRAKTSRWLHNYTVPCDALVMRDHTDIGRGGTEFKRQVVRGLPNFFKKDIHLVLEDREKLVQMWREEGYTCHQVREGTH